MTLCWANMSEKQTPHASTFTSTSPGPGSWSSTSSTVRSAPCDLNAACLYVLGSVIVARDGGERLLRSENPSLEASRVEISRLDTLRLKFAGGLVVRREIGERGRKGVGGGGETTGKTRVDGINDIPDTNENRMVQLAQNLLLHSRLRAQSQQDLAATALFDKHGLCDGCCAA